MKEGQFMRYGWIVGLFCRVVVVGRDFKVEEAETLVIKVPGVNAEGDYRSTRSFR